MSLISIVFITWLKYFQGVHLPLIFYAGLFPLWIVFFSMGVSLGESERNYKTWWLVVLLTVTLLLQFIEARCLNDIGGDGFGIKPSSFVFSAIMILLLFSKRVENKWNPNGLISRFFIWIGSLSFGIYLSHCLIINLVVNKIPCPYCHFWFLDWIITLGIDVVFILFIKKMLPKRIGRLLGVS